MWDLRLHSHYCCQIGYPTPHTAGSGDTSGQKGSFRLYLSHQHSRNLSNNVWNIWSRQDLRLLHSHRPLKIKIGDFGGNTHFPAGKYLTSPRTQRGRPGRDTVFVFRALYRWHASIQLPFCWFHEGFNTTSFNLWAPKRRLQRWNLLIYCCENLFP